MKLNKNLVLVGMMGSGKSLIGKILSKKLNFDFIDTDSKLKKMRKKLFLKYLKIMVKNILEILKKLIYKIS